jgi:hypothetical protein
MIGLRRFAKHRPWILALQPFRTIACNWHPLSFLLPCGPGIVTIFISLGWQVMRGASGVRSMVSGFNTEVEFEGTRFHIQTEVRKEADIETAVYVKGAVVHSLRTSHAGLSTADEGHEPQLMHLLEGQHRQVIEQIRAGEIRPTSVPAAISEPPE